MNSEPRGDKRYPSAQRVKVRCASWRDFSELYAGDVSQGGMFIQMDEPAALLTDLEVEIALPEGHTVALRARIVHVISREQAASDGRPTGVGVQFIDLDPTCKLQIQELVEFARWEGNTANRPSLAARLAQVTKSLPPSAVLQALPEPESRPAPMESQPDTAPAPRGDSAARRTPRERQSSQSNLSASVVARRQPSAPLRPTLTPQPNIDAEKLKLGITQLAHKNFALAIATLEGLVRDYPNHLESRQWLAVARARLCLKQDDRDGAEKHYLAVLDLDERNHEARRFVREHSSSKRLNAIPFGRYFVKKS